jgi:RNA polymerase sigma factor (sigma-70 family)
MTREEYSRYVATHYDGLLRFIRSRGVADADAEDILQTTLLKLLLSCDEIDPARPDGFIFTALRHAIVDHWRKRGRQPPTGPLPDQLEDTDPPDLIVAEGDAEQRCRDLLAEAVAGLTPRERTAFAAYWRKKGDRPAALEALRLPRADPRERYRVYDGPLHHARRKLTLSLVPHWGLLADVGYFRLWTLLNEVLDGPSQDADLGA